MKVEIWSDVVCPWCYIGKRRFESALSRFAHSDEVDVRWRSFELDPAAPRERSGSGVEHLAAKYRVSRTQAQAMQDRVTEVAVLEGLDFRFDIARPGNSFDAHRVLHLGAERGCQDAAKERLMAAYFSEGEPIGDVGTLIRLAGEAGLDEGEVGDTLAGDAYAQAVRADETQARRFGISGVPFFVIDGAYGVSGAQPAELLLEVLDEARASSHQRSAGSAASGASCDDGTCAT
jgi:predicted DsbA family dithiol-disulfide isomerase